MTQKSAEYPPILIPRPRPLIKQIRIVKPAPRQAPVTRGIPVVDLTNDEQPPRVLPTNPPLIEVITLDSSSEERNFLQPGPSAPVFRESSNPNTSYDRTIITRFFDRLEQQTTLRH